MTTTVQPVQVPNDGGVVPTDLSSAIVTTPNINAFDNNDEETFLLITTNSTGPISVTLKNQTVQDGSPGPDKVITIAATTTKLIGPIPPVFYNDSNRRVSVVVDLPANIAKFYAFKLR